MNSQGATLRGELLSSIKGIMSMEEFLSFMAEDYQVLAKKYQDTKLEITTSDNGTGMVNWIIYLSGEPKSSPSTYPIVTKEYFPGTTNISKKTVVEEDKTVETRYDEYGFIYEEKTIRGERISAVYYDQDSKISCTYKNENLLHSYEDKPSEVTVFYKENITVEKWHENGINYRSEDFSVISWVDTNILLKKVLTDKQGKMDNSSEPSIIVFHRNGNRKEEHYYLNDIMMRRDLSQPSYLLYSEDGVVLEEYYTNIEGNIYKAMKYSYTEESVSKTTKLFEKFFPSGISY